MTPASLTIDAEAALADGVTSSTTTRSAAEPSDYSGTTAAGGSTPADPSPTTPGTRDASDAVIWVAGTSTSVPSAAASVDVEGSAAAALGQSGGGTTVEAFGNGSERA